MFGFIKKAVKSVSGAVKSVTKNPLVKLAGSAALVIPGAGSVVAGVQIADTLVKAANGKPHAKVVNGKVSAVTNPAEIAARQQKAKSIIATTQRLAVQGKSPQVRQAARNGLTLMAKRAAALRFTKGRFRVNPRGVVVKVG